MAVAVSRRYNETPVSLREGKMFLDGVKIMDTIKATIKWTPEVWSGNQLGDLYPSERYLGAKIVVEITQRRSTNALKELIKQYQIDKKTPEFTIQGIMDDPASDYFAVYGSDTITVVGCVLNGDVNLLTLDAAGQVIEDSLTYNGRGIV